MEVAQVLPSGEHAVVHQSVANQVQPLNAVWSGTWPQTEREFERLVDVFQHRLVRHAYRIVGNLADAEDVAQEAFVRAFRDREHRRAVANVGAYLYRSTTNLAVDLVRRRHGHTVSIDENPTIFEIPSNDPGACWIAACAEGLQRVEALLRTLPKEQAEAVRLRVLDELPPRDIADVLGCQVKTVKSRLRHALEKLRERVICDGRVKR